MRRLILNFLFLTLFILIANTSIFAQCGNGTITPTNNWALNKTVQVTDFGYWQNFYDVAKLNDGNMNTSATFLNGSYGDPGDYEIVIDLGSDRIVDFLKVKYVTDDPQSFFMDFKCYDSNNYEVFTHTQTGASFDGNLQIDNVVRYVKVYFQCYNMYQQCAFFELQALTTVGNLALGVPPTSTMNTLPNDNTKAVDDDINTYFNAAGPVTTGPYVYEVDLQNPSLISHIEMIWNTPIASCDVQAYYDDGYNATWISCNVPVNVSSSTINYSSPNAFNWSFIKKIKITYFRFGATTNLRLKELRVYGKQTHTIPAIFSMKGTVLFIVQ